MNLALQWRRPDPALVMRWRGADSGLAVQITTNPPRPVPTIIGPPGIAGPAGPQGPQADLTAAVIDGGTFN
jgi:hypothetical protein